MVLFIIYLISIIIFKFSFESPIKVLNEKKKKVVPKLRQEVKVKVDIVTSDGIKIYYTGKIEYFQNHVWYFVQNRRK